MYQAISALSMAEITPGHRPPNQAHRTTMGKYKMKGAFKPRKGSSAKRKNVANATVRTVKAYRKSIEGLRSIVGNPLIKPGYAGKQVSYSPFNCPSHPVVASQIRFML